MERTCWLILLAAIGIASTGEGTEPPKASVSPVKTRVEIADASVDAGGTIAVLLQQLGNDATQYRLLILDRTGKTLRQEPIVHENDNLISFQRLIPWGQGHAVAWAEAGKGLVIARIQNGSLKTETILPDDPSDGSFGGFWILDVGKKPALLVARDRYFNAEEQPQVGRQYAWLYCYSLADAKPVLLGKSCVEDDETRSAKIVCASNGTGISIWQSVFEKGSPIQTIRVADWSNAGKLTWRGRYTGNDPLAFLVDSSSGNICLVQEWKSPEDASGILSFVQAEATAVSPVGFYGESRSDNTTRFLYLPELNSWVVAQKGKADILITVFHRDFTAPTFERLPAEGVSDYAIVSYEKRIQAVLLCRGEVSIKTIELATQSPMTRPAIK